MKEKEEVSKMAKRDFDYYDEWDDDKQRNKRKDITRDINRRKSRKLKSALKSNSLDPKMIEKYEDEY